MDSVTFARWSTSVTVVSDTAQSVDRAVVEVLRTLDEVECAASRFRPDSEVCLLTPGTNHVSDMLADLLAHALHAASTTDGLVDPTVGLALVDLGYDRSFERVEATEAPVRAVRSGPSWRTLSLEGDRLVVPPGVLLDLGATAKARAADLAADRAHRAVGACVLVSIGGDIATAGDQREMGWQVRVQDTDEDPGTQVTLTSGHGIATSSTARRVWLRGGRSLHHIVDPRTAAPAPTIWRSVTVAAPTCVEANTSSTAAVILGVKGPRWLRERGYAARLVDQRRRVVRVGEWPEEVAA